MQASIQIENRFGIIDKDDLKKGDLKNSFDVILIPRVPGSTTDFINETDKKFLTSLLANFVIKNSNPKGDDEVRVQQVYLTRNTNRSLFYLTWKTIFKGISETVGIKQPVEVASK